MSGRLAVKSVTLERGKSCFYKDLVLKSCALWVFLELLLSLFLCVLCTQHHSMVSVLMLFCSRATGSGFRTDPRKKKKDGNKIKAFVSPEA